MDSKSHRSPELVDSIHPSGHPGASVFGDAEGRLFFARCCKAGEWLVDAVACALIEGCGWSRFSYVRFRLDFVGVQGSGSIYYSSLSIWSSWGLATHASNSSLSKLSPNSAFQLAYVFKSLFASIVTVATL